MLGTITVYTATLGAVQTALRGTNVLDASEAGLFSGELEELVRTEFTLIPDEVKIWEASGIVLPNGAKAQKFTITKGWLHHRNARLDFTLFLFLGKVMRNAIVGQTPNWDSDDLRKAYVYFIIFFFFFFFFSFVPILGHLQSAKFNVCISFSLRNACTCPPRSPRSPRSPAASYFQCIFMLTYIVCLRSQVPFC